MGLIAFTANHTDHSNETGYQFEFHCDHCRNGYTSTFQASTLGVAGGFLRAASHLFGGVFGNVAAAGDNVKDALRGKARDEAYAKAVEEAKPHFKQCGRCGKWVCPEKCWNTSRSLCTGCAPDLQKEAAAIQAQVAVEQMNVKAREIDQTEDMDLKAKQRAECPHCGAPAANSKFCSECGKPLAGIEKFCGDCGEKLKADAKFCPKCGKPQK